MSILGVNWRWVKGLCVTGWRAWLTTAGQQSGTNGNTDFGRNMGLRLNPGPTTFDG